MQTVLCSNQVFIGRYLIFYSAIRFHLGRIALQNSIELIFFRHWMIVLISENDLSCYDNFNENSDCLIIEIAIDKFFPLKLFLFV